MKTSYYFLVISLVVIVARVSASVVQSNNDPQQIENKTLTPSGFLSGDKRPSFWTKTANNMKTSTISRINKPYGNITRLYRRFTSRQSNAPQYTSENIPAELELKMKRKYKPIVEKMTTENVSFENTTPPLPDINDLEEKIMKDESFIGLKEFASQLINNTAKFFTRKSGTPRSYMVDEPPQHQLWDDKDQTYHASSFTNAEYEPTSYHHHYIPPHPLHYYAPPKKDDALFTKVATIALLKLILAKLKALGFLKLIFLFMMKVPILFFKFLFILKSFKILKLVSIPFIIASFAAPFLPMIPFLAPLLFAPLLLAPLLLPLILPLLFFLPIFPVTTPPSASAATRNRREAIFNSPTDEFRTGNETRARYLRTRVRPMSNEKNTFEYLGKVNNNEETENRPSLIELTQKIVDSENCIERIACELASQNESKIYQAAVMWALKKVNGFASPRVRRKIERYTEAYKTGAKWQTPGICRNKFYCQRPKVFLIQGKSKYNVL